jgi:hypothetical protein
MVEIASTESLLGDLKHASAILGLSIWTVRDLVWSETIPAHRIGRKIFIKTSDSRAYVAALVAQTTCHKKKTVLQLLGAVPVRSKKTGKSRRRSEANWPGVHYRTVLFSDH